MEIALRDNYEQICQVPQFRGVVRDRVYFSSVPCYTQSCSFTWLNKELFLKNPGIFIFLAINDLEIVTGECFNLILLLTVFVKRNSFSSHMQSSVHPLIVPLLSEAYLLLLNMYLNLCL